MRPGSTEDFGKAQITAVETGAQVEVVRIVFLDRARNDAEVATHREFEEGREIRRLDVAGGGRLAVARPQPVQRGSVTGIPGGQGEVVGKRTVTQRHFVVRKMSKQPGIVFVRGELPGVFVAKRLEVWIEHEDAVAGITGVAGFLRRAAALLAIARHEVPNAGVNQGRSGGAQALRVRPCAQAIEAVFAQQRGRAFCPVGFAAELLFPRGLRSGRAEHADRGDAFVKEQATLRIHEPPTPIPLRGVKETRGLLPARRQAAVAAQAGVGFDRGRPGHVGQRPRGTSDPLVTGLGRDLDAGRRGLTEGRRGQRRQQQSREEGESGFHGMSVNLPNRNAGRRS